MSNLIATKALTYRTRRLVAGDLFEARPRDARLLVAIGKARDAAVGAQPVRKPAPAANTAVAPLRAEYERVVGKKPFNGWDAATLQEKIAAAKSEG